MQLTGEPADPAPRERAWAAQAGVAPTVTTVPKRNIALQITVGTLCRKGE